MLASTVQFSNNNPTPTNTTTHPGRSPKQFGGKAGPEKETNNRKQPSQVTPPCPSSQDPTAYLQPLAHHTARSNSPQQRNGPPQPQRIDSSHVVLDTHDKQIPELVSVPPVSSTAERTPARGPEPSMHPATCVNSKHNRCGPVAP
jgi:hypothetical protein